MRDTLIIYSILLFTCINARAMEVAVDTERIQRAMDALALEHNSSSVYVPLTTEAAEDIYRYASLYSGIDVNANEFAYPISGKKNRKVFHLAKPRNGRRDSTIGCEERDVFAVDWTGTFDEGASTEIRLAERIVETIDENKKRFYQTKIVAVKILDRERKKEAQDDEYAEEDFLNDVRVLQHLNSSYRVYDDGRYIYHFMDFIPGANLEKKLKEDLPEEDKIGIALAATEALLDLHDYFVIHNDLKSGNIKVWKDASGNWVGTFLDFGISHLMNEQIERVLGSMGYRDPLRLGKNRTPSGIQSDLWGLGVLFFEIFAKRKNNYQEKIAFKKAEMVGKSTSWDPETKEDFTWAFPDSVGPKAKVEPGTPRERMIKLAKKLTTLRYIRSTPQEMREWVKSFKEDFADYCYESKGGFYTAHRITKTGKYRTGSVDSFLGHVSGSGSRATSNTGGLLRLTSSGGGFIRISPRTTTQSTTPTTTPTTTTTTTTTTGNSQSGTPPISRSESKKEKRERLKKAAKKVEIVVGGGL